MEIERAFNKGSDEAGSDVPFDVAMEEPDTWVGRSMLSITEFAPIPIHVNDMV